MNEPIKQDPTTLHHGEYKIPGGKLVVVDLRVEQGRLCDVQLSGDFFLEPPETLDIINVALNGLPFDATAQQITQVVDQVLGPNIMMFGINAEGIAIVIHRALS